MTVASGVRPVIDRSDVDSVLVGIVSTGDRDRQRAAAEAVVAHWQTSRWPAGLVSLTCYTSTDGESLLTYAQWSAEDALRESLRDEAGISRGIPGWGVAGVGAFTPVPFRLYRIVRGSAVTSPAPVPECFPVAFFTMSDYASASQWIDGLLDAEVEAEGEERAYPGALAANFHISVDGTQVLVLSEWVSEEEAIAHIAAVWEPILEQVGGDAGARYHHYLTVSGPAES